MAFLFEPIAKPDHDPNRPGPIKAKWEFTRDELSRSPSVLGGLSLTEEQRLIRRGTTVVRKIVDRLNETQKDVSKITQLCVSVSIIQLRRFFTIQSLKNFDPRDVGAAILFMTTKSEECPRRLEYIVCAWFKILYESDNKPSVDATEQVIINKETYDKFCEYITWLENIVLQTIGFNFGAEVPHPIVLNMAARFRPDDKKFQESVFWLVTDVLHLTNWSLMYKANRIATVCFYMASIWKDETPKFPPNEGDVAWYSKLDNTITLTQMQDMTKEFLIIWKDIDKTTNLSMSQFDHKSIPIIFEQFVGSPATRHGWNV